MPLTSYVPASTGPRPSPRVRPALVSTPTVPVPAPPRVGPVDQALPIRLTAVTTAAHGASTVDCCATSPRSRTRPGSTSPSRSPQGHGKMPFAGRRWW